MANAIVRLGNKSSAWFTANASRLLADGQLVYLNDNSGTFKKGDGITTLSALPFLGGGSAQSLAQTLAVDKKTGEQDITSDDGTSTTSIKNGYTDIRSGTSNKGYVYVSEALAQIANDNGIVGVFEGTPLSPRYIQVKIAKTVIKHGTQIDLDAPSVTKNGVEVATVNQNNIATNYPTPLDADKIGIWDVANSLFKSVTWANIKATLNSTYLQLSGGALTGLLKLAKSTNIASATTTDLSTATGNLVHITGTTTITAFGTLQAGTKIDVVFDGILTLTHNATSLILPGGLNITTIAGDSATFISEGSGNWKCASYQPNQAGVWTTWVPTYTGFSADPTGIVAKVYNDGSKTVINSLYASGLGTSSGTTCTITLSHVSNITMSYACTVVDTSSTVKQGKVSITSGSNVAVITTSVAGAAWGASGSTKNVLFLITYEAQ